MTDGLDVARSFFAGWGLPYVQDEYPHLVDRVAAVLCGGSQSLGNDDELSRDHGWGPQFELVLTGEDKRRFGRGLSTQINRDAPAQWQGYSLKTAHRVEVSSINRWFRGLVGRDLPPVTNKDWYHKTNEENLCMVRHATLFHDPLGEWSARRQEFSTYPDLVWKWRARDDLWNIWHFGQYNFLDRLTRRKDPVAVAAALAKVSEGVMRLSLVLQHEYCPYWKWLAAQFRKLPDVEQLDHWLGALTTTLDIDEQADLVRKICAEVHSRVVGEFDLEPNPKGHPHPLLLAHKELEEQGRQT